MFSSPIRHRVFEWVLLGLAVGGFWLNPTVTAAQVGTPAADLPSAKPGAEAAPVDGPGSEASTPSTCTSANLLLGAHAYVPGVANARPAIDGRLAQEGTLWNQAGRAVVLKDGGKLMVDMRTPQNVGALVLQGDNNEQYVVEGSLDGREYTTLWRAPAVEGEGLRTRYTKLSRPETVRYLRVWGHGGDGYFSVSELRAHCETPAEWPPAMTHPPKKVGWAAIDNNNMVVIKGCLAAAGALLLLVGYLLRRRGLGQRFKRTRDVALGVLGLMSFLSWWNIGHYHFDHYIHIWEHYHYYMGAKYAPELGFSRLYECTAAADMEDGKLKQVKERKMRDLAGTNKLGTTTEIVADPTRCTKHFTPERWEAFRKDNRFFRSRFSADRWDKSQADHGYNATPVWTIGGRLLADMAPASWEVIERLGYIDSVLLVLMWGVVWWAFGWRAMCVALLWWGTNFPARFYWNGGSFLRFDWLLFLVVGVCLLKREKMFSGGMALTLAALLRIFPGFVVIALILKALMHMMRERRFVLSRAHRRFAAGCLVAMALLVPASGWATNGLDSWVSFAENSRKHMKTALTNNMGFKTFVGYDIPTRAKVMRNDKLEDPFAEWKDARQRAYAARMPLFLAAILAFLVLLALAVEKEKEWVAVCLGAGAIVMIPELTCYYYGFLLLYGFLWLKREQVGIATCALSAITCAFYFMWGWNDDHFAAMSLACSVTVVGVTYYWWRENRMEARRLAQPATASKSDSAAAA